VRALAFDPALRFRSASELATELRRIAGTKLAPGGAVAQKVMDLAGERIRTRRAELDASPTGQQRRVSSKKLEVALPIDGDRPTALPGEAGATQPSPPPVTSPPPQVVVAPAALTPRISTPAKPPPPKKKPALVNEPPAQPISPALEAAAAATTPEPPTIVKLPERLPLHTGFGAEPPTKRDIVEKPLPIRSFAPAAPKPPPPKKDPPKIIAVSPKKPPPPDSSPKLRAPAESAPMLRDDAPGPAPESGDEIRVERESGSSLRADAITGDRPSGPIASVPITEDPPKESGPVLAPAPESAPRLAIDFASEQIPPPIEQPAPPASDPVLPIAAPESGARIAAAPIDVDLPPPRPRFRSSATPSGEIVPVPPTRRRLAPLVALILVVAGVLAAIGVIVSVIRGNDSHEPLVPPRVANASTSTQETPPATATVTATAEPAPPPASADPAPPTTAEEPQQQQQPMQQAPSFAPKKKRTYEPLGI
jgi:hypothetical protein